MNLLTRLEQFHLRAGVSRSETHPLGHRDRAKACVCEAKSVNSLASVQMISRGARAQQGGRPPGGRALAVSARQAAAYPLTAGSLAVCILPAHESIS